MVRIVIQQKTGQIWLSLRFHTQVETAITSEDGASFGQTVLADLNIGP